MDNESNEKSDGDEIVYLRQETHDTPRRGGFISRLFGHGGSTVTEGPDETALATGGSGIGSHGSGGSGGGSHGSGGSGTVPYFVAGTMIDTRQGRVPVERLLVGDQVLTRDHGYQPVILSGCQRYPAQWAKANWALHPVMIMPGAFQGTKPDRPLLVSPQHRILCHGAKVEMLFGTTEVLAPATDLENGTGIVHVTPEGDLSYHHVLFENRQIICANGLWCESLFPGDMALSALSGHNRDAISNLPEQGQSAIKSACLCLKPFEAKLLSGDYHIVTANMAHPEVKVA